MIGQLPSEKVHCTGTSRFIIIRHPFPWARKVFLSGPPLTSEVMVTQPLGLHWLPLGLHLR